MMADKTQIDDLVKRTYRYFYDDGLVELGIGVLFLMLSLVLFGWLALGSTPWISILIVVITVLLILAAPFLVKRAVRVMKERVTYQRTGYVAYRPGEPGIGRWIMIGAVILLVVVMFVMPEWFNQISVAVGIFLAIILAWFGYRVNLWRFYLVAGVALITGILAALVGMDEIIGTALTFAATGLLLVITGGVTLQAYLRRHPRPEGDIDHE